MMSGDLRLTPCERLVLFTLPPYVALTKREIIDLTDISERHCVRTLGRLARLGVIESYPAEDSRALKYRSSQSHHLPVDRDGS